MYFIFVGTKLIQTAAGLVCFDTQDDAADFMDTAVGLSSFAVPPGGGIRCADDDDDGEQVDIDTIPRWPVGQFAWVEQAIEKMAA